MNAAANRSRPVFTRTLREYQAFRISRDLQATARLHWVAEIITLCVLGFFLLGVRVDDLLLEIGGHLFVAG